MGRGPFHFVGGYHRRWPDSYIKTQPDHDIDYRVVDLWTQENPNPMSDRGPDVDNDELDESFNVWIEARKIVIRRARLMDLLPQFEVLNWTDEDVVAVYAALPSGACGVCGRIDDPGCVLGC